MADDRPPFDMTRAVFWLIATVVVLSTVTSVYAATACILTEIKTDATICSSLKLKDFMGELLAVCLVLLNAKPPPK